MSNDYISTELNKILDQKDAGSKALALATTWVIANQKGEQIKIFDVKQSSTLADYYVIASTQNKTQSQAIADTLKVSLKNHANKGISLEGTEEGEWILIDLGNVIVHLFQDHSRSIYDLDSLWRGQSQVQIPEEYYFSSHTTTAAPTKSNTENYF